MRGKTYAFIDSQNLNLGTSKNIYKNNKVLYKGWKLDFRKFNKYLSYKFNVKKSFLFIGYIKNNWKLYKFLKSCGYNLIFKPTVKNMQGQSKGNIDAELVLYSAKIEYDNYDRAIIVSGDGDFYCLHKFLSENNKLYKIIIPNKHNESSLLNEFQKLKIFLYRERDKLLLKPNKNGRRRS